MVPDSDAKNQALTPDHLAMLQTGSGIAEDVIAARGYRTATGYSELKSLGMKLALR